MVSKPLRRLLTWMKPGSVSFALQLHDERQFHAVLNKERVRAERYGTRFALVLFQAREKQALTSILRQRLRVTDEIGLFQGQVAALLYDIDRLDARRLVEQILLDQGGPNANCRFTVYEFPEQTSRNTPVGDWHDQPRSGELEPVAAQSMETLFVRRLPLWKRSLDVCGALAGLIVLAPVLLLTAAAIRISSPGPILFTQKRRGLGGREFTIYKFRTMCPNADRLQADLRQFSEQDGPAFKIKNDPRVTRVGQFLRKSCIDELPQLWNVLIGDMSLVGPRPLPCDESDQCQSWERRRLHVTPGLTCIWQVDGGSRVSFPDWMRMDIRYIARCSLGADLRLLWRTLVEVLMHRASC